MNLKTNIPVNLDLTIRSGQLFHWTKIANNTFKIIIRRTVIKANQINENIIKVEIKGEKLDEEKLRTTLGLNIERQKLLTILKKDKLISQIIPSYEGLTIMKQDPYECLISFLTSAVSNIPRIMLNLNELRGETGTLIMESNEKSLPSANNIVCIGEKKLRHIGFGYRSKFIYLTCNKIVKEQICLETWGKKTNTELLALLTQFPGVGRKIAECVMLFGFGRLSAFPVDVWVQRGLIHLMPTLKALSPVDLSEWGTNRWGDAAGMAQQIVFCAAKNGGIFN